MMTHTVNAPSDANIPSPYNDNRSITPMRNNDNVSDSTNYWPLILLSVCVVGLFGLSWWWLAVSINNPEKQGQFGDQFGAVNALFSGLAFAGLIFTIILQKKELALQREELTQTREELKGQKEQLEEQNKTLKIQRFENTFFQMLTQFQEIVNNITYSYKDIHGRDYTVKGREAFYQSFEVAEHKTKLSDWNPAHINHQYVGMRDIIQSLGYDGYMESFTPTYFDHYFRFLYRILRFIQTSPLVSSFEEEYEYTCMLRATLSRYELVWLYYNGLSYGKDKLKPLIERYAMLNNLRDDLLADEKVKFGSYEPSAWKKISPIPC